MRKLILVAAVLCAGCGGVEPITEEEAVGILAALTELWFEADVDDEGGTASVSCPSGGSATVEVLRDTGDLDGDTIQEGDTLRLGAGWSIRPAACAVTSAGTPFTVDGDPDLRMQWEALAIYLLLRRLRAGGLRVPDERRVHLGQGLRGRLEVRG